MKHGSWEEFEKEVRTVFAFLELHGFNLQSQLTSSSSVLCSLSYHGNTLGFKFSYDVRDEAISVYIYFLVGDLRPKREDLTRLTSFLDERGYRGGTAPVVERPCCSQTNRSKPMRAQLCAWSDLLLGPGKPLLEDTPEAIARIDFSRPRFLP